MSEKDTAGNDILEQYKALKTKETCPNCGYCPHCGRSAQPYYPQPYYPVTPWWQAPYYPQPTWVCGSSGTAIQSNASTVFLGGSTQQ